MNAKTIIETLGGPARVGKLAGGISSQAVSQWTEIPVLRCPAIAAGSGGRYTVHDLRPDFFGPAPGSPQHLQDQAA